MDYLFGTPTRKFGNAAMALLLKQGIEKRKNENGTGPLTGLSKFSEHFGEIFKDR